MEYEDKVSMEDMEEATVVVHGTSPVVNDREVKTDAAPMSPEAPYQSPPSSKDELPENVIKLKVSADGWNPSEFTVQADSPITIFVSSVDSFTHVFKFEDPSLSAVAIGVSPGETRVITFNASSEPGEYSFRCDIPGHTRRGEVGKMIVN